MSPVVLGAVLWRHIPPAPESGVTATDLAREVDLHPRSVQRHLREMERAGLVHRAETAKPWRWRRA